MSRLDHELGVKMAHVGAKKPTERLPPADAQQVAKNRMYTFDFNRLKTTGGTITAQTPSSASAPDQLGTLVGADTQSVTAANQSTRTGRRGQTPGGGRHAAV